MSDQNATYGNTHGDAISDATGAHTHAVSHDAHAPAVGESNGATEPPPGAIDDPNTHTLDTPLVRGAQTITTITLRKPKSGELRGASLSDLVSLDVGALSKVLPRISSPTLTEHDVANIDPADLVMLGGIFVGFLTPKAVKSKLASQSA
jgi:hypothetical protein